MGLGDFRGLWGVQDLQAGVKESDDEVFFGALRVLGSGASDL